MITDPVAVLRTKVTRRNIAARKVERLTDQLYAANQALADRESDVRRQHSKCPPNTMIHFADNWTVND